MADYITTYTGLHFCPAEPDAKLLDIRDIAHSLSMQCRANGHYKTFFSVAKHCILCAEEAEARGYDRRVMLACLLHDATEAYIADVPKPVKVQLTTYNEIEDNLANVIYGHFLGGITEDEKKIVKEIDNIMLYNEFKALMGEEIGEKAELKSHPVFDFTDPAQTEAEYIEMFNRLK